MKTEITSLDLHFLARELQAIVGSKVDKIYEQEDDKKDFLFTFHKSGYGKAMLRIKLPGIIYLTENKAAFPETPPGFCVFLRKHLGNSKVSEVKQKGFERILEIVFETKEGRRTLVCELFSKGNMILIDEELKIKGLLESQNWEARTIRGGTKYQYPPAQTETPKLTMAEFEKIITSTPFDSIVKTFAIELGLGGFYAEELCTRIGVAKEKKRLSYEELQKAFLEINKMIRSDIKANLTQGEILPFETDKTPDKTFDSFNQSLDYVLSEKIDSATEIKEAKEKRTKEKKITTVIEKQETRLKELEQSVADNQKKGELIYEHYSDVKDILQSINSDRKKMNWEELKKKYKNIQIDEKKGNITIDL
jgi:predicted ribosome quality control (RQC) complex YloA/Tae2 family protein